MRGRGRLLDAQAFPTLIAFHTLGGVIEDPAGFRSCDHRVLVQRSTLVSPKRDRPADQPRIR